MAPSTVLSPAQLQSENDYEDLLSLWSDLEAGLAMLLGHPAQAREFLPRVRQYDRWMQALLAQDSDVGLYLLFQLSSNSPVGYSASHALICAVLCHLLAAELELAPDDRDSLIHAALTMNIGMTALQDQLAQQTTPLTPQQQSAVRGHAQQSRALLEQLGVTDPLWLAVVATHHAEDAPEQRTLAQLSPQQRLVRVLQVVDRYAAMISPRKSREGRSATESVRTVMAGATAYNDEVSHALVRAVGLCPPGSYVRMEDGSMAVVMRRSGKPHQPDVALVTRPDGEMLSSPRLHHPAERRPGIQSALASAVVRLRLNHHRLLQLTAAT
jgi:HD-GYP domain-containing protein (c-di-GMP phosphodiesterase class II)